MVNFILDTYFNCEKLATLAAVGSALRAHQNRLFGTSGDSRLEVSRLIGARTDDLRQLVLFHLTIHDPSLSSASSHSRGINGSIRVSSDRTA